MQVLAHGEDAGGRDRGRRRNPHVADERIGAKRKRHDACNRGGGGERLLGPVLLAAEDGDDGRKGEEAEAKHEPAPGAGGTAQGLRERADNAAKQPGNREGPDACSAAPRLRLCARASRARAR